MKIEVAFSPILIWADPNTGGNTGVNHPTDATVSLPTDLVLEDVNRSLISESKTLCAEHFDHSPADLTVSPKPY